MSLLEDTWTDTNGDPWDPAKWDAEAVGAGVIIDVQSNRGRMATDTGISKAARAVALHTPVTDAEVLFNFQATAATGNIFLYVTLRGDGNWYGVPPDVGDGFPNIGYSVEWGLGNSTKRLYKSEDTSFTQITSLGGSPQDTQKYWMRFRVQGTALRVKYWLDGESEPEAWNLFDTTDSSIAGPGVFQIGLANNASAISDTVHIDDLTLTQLGSDWADNGDWATNGDWADLGGIELTVLSLVESGTIT